LILSSVPTLRRKKGTEKLAPVICAHAEAEEGYREACPCPLCPRCDGRRAQRSLLLSSVPILRRKKGTEKLAPVTCAHAAAEEGHREACSCHLCPRCGRRRVQEGVRRMTPKIKTVICEQAPNHGSYFSYARLCFRNFQFTQSQSVSGIHSPFLFYSSVPDAPGRSDSGEYPDSAYAKHLREVSVLRLPNW